LFFFFLCTSYVASFSGHKMTKNKTTIQRQHRGYTR
jgi:hypothetical protein